jgi:hypothetical protein
MVNAQPAVVQGALRSRTTIVRRESTVSAVRTARYAYPIADVTLLILHDSDGLDSGAPSR